MQKMHICNSRLALVFKQGLPIYTMYSMLHCNKEDGIRNRLIALKTLNTKGFNQFPGALPGIEGPVSGPSRLPDVKPPCLKLAPEGNLGGHFFVR